MVLEPPAIYPERTLATAHIKHVQSGDGARSRLPRYREKIEQCSMSPAPVSYEWALQYHRLPVRRPPMCPRLASTLSSAWSCCPRLRSRSSWPMSSTPDESSALLARLAAVAAAGALRAEGIHCRLRRIAGRRPRVPATVTRVALLPVAARVALPVAGAGALRLTGRLQLRKRFWFLVICALLLMAAGETQCGFCVPHPGLQVLELVHGAVGVGLDELHGPATKEARTSVCPANIHARICLVVCHWRW